MQKSLRTQAVSVQHLPFKQPRYGLKADVRMWRYVHRLPVNEFDGPKVVEKNTTDQSFGVAVQAMPVAR